LAGALAGVDGRALALDLAPACVSTVAADDRSAHAKCRQGCGILAAKMIGEVGDGVRRKIAGRVRVALGHRDDVFKRKMFGGIAFMLHGNMACGVLRDELMPRLGPEAAAKSLKLKHARPMDFTGRPMTGMLYVGADGIRTAKQLRSWLDKAETFADTLPPK
jgi:hypothetical protein